MSKIIVHTDGGALGNPGPAAIGVVIEAEGKTKEYSQYIGRATNNQAEYKALIFSLKKLKQLFGKKKIKELEIECYVDSQLVANHLSGNNKIKNEKLQPLFIEAWNLQIDFKNVRFIYTPREKNKQADKLVGKALNNLTEND